MAVRNFWVEGQIDGRQSKLAGGPARKDGGLNLSVFQREDGGIVTAFKVCCYEVDGNLITEVIDRNGALVASCETNR